MKANGNWIAELNRRPPNDMHHDEWLIQRIIVPEGAPMVTKSSSMKTEWIVPQIVTIDRPDERDGMFANNAAIRPAQEADDQVTAELLQRILLMEEGHLDWAEQHSDPIEQTGRENVLAKKTTYEVP
jgi:bacterioferritin (cytochrome b1)